MQDRFLQFLGIAKKAHRLSLGHDCALAAMKNGKAKLCLISSDASERLFHEFARLREAEKTKVLRISYTMQEIGVVLGSRAGVFTVDDPGFAGRIREMCGHTNREECSL